MKHLITFSSGADFYEVLYEDNTIYKITKFMNGGMRSRDLGFDEISEEVKQKIVDKMTENGDLL